MFRFVKDKILYVRVDAQLWRQVNAVVERSGLGQAEVARRLMAAGLVHTGGELVRDSWPTHSKRPRPTQAR